MSPVDHEGPPGPALAGGPAAPDGSTTSGGQETIDDLLEIIQEAYLRLDGRGAVIRANAAAAAITGLATDQMLGQTMSRIWPRWGEGPATNELIECLERRRDCVVVAVLPQPGNHPRWIRMRLDHLADGARILALDVTEKVLAEQACTDSEARYRTLFSYTSQGVVHLDRQGRISEANPAALEILGLSRDQILGREPKDSRWRAVFENGSDFPAPLHPSMLALTTGQEILGQVMGVYNPVRQETRWLMVNATPEFQAGEGTPFQVFVTFADITELKIARDQARLLSEFPRQNPHPVLRLDREGRLIYANPAASPLLECWQVSEGDLLPDDKVRLTKRLLRLNRAEILEEDCPPQIIALNFSPLPGVDMVNVYGMDITELKQAQQALAWQLEVRTILSEFSRALIASPPHDISQLCLRVLGQARTLTGSTLGYVGVIDPKTGALNAHSLHETGAALPHLAQDKGQLCLKPDGEGRYPTLWGHSLNTRRGFFTNQPADHPVYRAHPEDHTGLERLLSVPVLLTEELVGQAALANPTRDFDQRDLAAVTQLSDIFALALQRLRAQESQRRVEEQLRQSQKMEALGALAGGIAHDFNNLLQAMRGYVQLAQYDEGISRDTASQLRAVDAAVTRASEMVRRILTFSRQVEPRKRPLNFNELLGQELRMLERTLPKMISLRTSLAGDLRLVDADPVQMEQVILNLANNARDAMSGTGTLIIETSNVLLDDEFVSNHPGTKTGAYIWLRVSDSGHGMDPETAKQVFEPFFTTKQIGLGTGLGLSTVYGIIKAHDGHITVYSEPGVGTTFNIFLPALQGAVQEKEAEKPPEAIKGGQETILLVDDEASILDAGRRLLKRNGYSVLTALSGEEALEVYARNQGQLDLVVMDLGMPGMGGFRTLVEMRRRYPEVKIVVASGYAPQAQGQDVFQAGAAAFLHKPYQLPDLLRTVRKILDSPAPPPPA